jgi:GcrA cell cycle regulator
MPGQSDWTEDLDERVKTLWGLGRSASEIAALVGGGKTRCAIIGRLHRLGLKRRDKQTHIEARFNAKRQWKAKKPNRTKLERPPEPKAEPFEPAPPPDVEPVTSVTFAELESHHCRWPYGEREHRFCGCRRVAGAPYCEAHIRRAYRAAPKRRATDESRPVRTKEFA